MSRHTLPLRRIHELECCIPMVMPQPPLIASGIPRLSAEPGVSFNEESSPGQSCRR
jgi:hypothetical protein